MNTLEYTALEKLQVDRPVDRLQFMAQAAQGKYVLDLGALDETAYQLKQNSEFWLHKRLAEKAKYVRGIDCSDLIVDKELKTFDNAVIQFGDVFDLTEIVNEAGVPELIVAGELIEHLPNALLFLETLRSIEALRGTRFIFSTPNACSLHNFIIGLFKRESTHCDHLSIQSFKTLHTLCRCAEFESWNCIPYYMKFPEMISKSSGLAKIATISFEKVVNVGEWAFPLLCGGWVVDVTI